MLVRHVLVLWHFSSHANKLLDEEFKDRILVLSLHLGQLLQLGDLYYIRVFFKLFLLN